MARILVIDDDYQIRKTLHQVLEREGHEVADARDGGEGLRYFNETGADLIITDILMPEKEGIETIKELREGHPDLKIIAISGGGALDPRFYLHLAERLGVNRTIIKPFSIQELLAAVRALS